MVVGVKRAYCNIYMYMRWNSNSLAGNGVSYCTQIKMRETMGIVVT